MKSILTNSTVQLVLGLAIALTISLLFLRAAIPTQFASSNLVEFQGNCYIAKGATPERYDSAQEYLNEDPKGAQRSLTLQTTNCGGTPVGGMERSTQ